MRRGMLLAAVTGLFGALSFPSTAPAAQVIGQTDPLPNECGNDVSLYQEQLTGGTGYSPTAYGVITSWSTMTRNNTDKQMKLLVLRPNPTAGAYHHITVQKDQMRTLTLPSQLNTFFVRLPIEANEKLGLNTSPTIDKAPCDFGGVAGDVAQFRLNSGDPPLATSLDYPVTNSFQRLNVTAVVEPDADRDGFGDETQDECDVSAKTQSACVCKGRPATIAGGPAKDKLKGTSKKDVIAGLGGKDTIRGRGGNDIICGGAGKDKLIGGRGRDKLIGGGGKDKLIGGRGKDTQVQ